MNKSLVTLHSIAVPKGLQTGPFGSQLKAEEYSKCGVPVVMPKDICNGKIIINGIARVPEKKANKLAKHRILAGDIVFPRRGDLGRIGVATQENEGWLCGSGCLRVRLKDDVDVDYIHQYVQLTAVKQWLETNALGQTMLNLNSEIIGNLPIFIVPKNEQKMIAVLLMTWDAAIEKTERLIEAKEKKFSWLRGQIIHANIKKWSHPRISEIADRVQRKSDGGSHPILTISSRSGFVLQEEKYSRFMAGKSLEDYILLEQGEFAYNKGNSLRFQFGCIFQLQNYKAALVPHVYVCFKLREGIDPGYLCHVFQADYLNRQLGAIVNSGVRNNGLLNLRPADFMRVTVPIPPLDLQKQIAETLSTARQEIDLLRRQAEAYQRQKRGLMQKLLTGKWRVKS